MLKIKKDTSVRISLALAIIALVTLAVVLALLPWIVRYFLNETDYVRMKYFVPALVLLYSASLPVAVADIMLIRLLALVRKSQVFTPQSVGSLRGISWCCFGESLILLSVGLILFNIFAPVICVTAFAAAFLGIVLRVVKNVIEEAVAIKSENDFTI